MTKILLISLVNPDFLPPVYSIAQVLQSEGYKVDIITFESNAPGNFYAGENIIIHTVAKHGGSAYHRVQTRKLFSTKVQEYINRENPKAIFSYCEFSYLTALKTHKGIPIFYFVLELTNFRLKNIFKSTLGALRTWQANSQLDKAYFISTPSYERSGWLAGRYKTSKIPETIQNTPYISLNHQFDNEYSKLLPDQFKDKIRILNTGGVNDTRSVIELVLGFEKTEIGNCLIITNVSDNDYSIKLKKVVNDSKRKTDILLLGTISREDLIALQSSCQIGICLMKLQNGFDERMLAPNKVGEYFRSGSLVLGMNTPYFHQFIPYKTTELVSDLSPESIAKGLEKLGNQVNTTNYRDNILNCLKEWYNMTRQMEQVLKLLQSI